MQEIQSDQGQFLLQAVYLPGLTNEHRLTKRVLEAIPADKGDYRPDEISKTALELAWHIVATEMLFMDAVEEGAFDFSPKPRPESVKTSSDLVDWYAGAFNERLEKLTQLPGEKLVRVIDFRGVLKLPSVMYLDFLLHHSVHHRGQLSMYLRPMGAKVPPIYGESYDSAQARKG